MTDQPQLPEAELAALADGSLPADRAERLRARIDQSPELSAALADQERAITMLRALDEPAPAALHARVGELTDGASRRRRTPRWSRSLFLPAVTVAAVAVAALVVLVGGGSSGNPTVPQTVRLALASATQSAPADNGRGQLRLSVGGIAFPYYENTSAWEATGSRTDTLRGRRVVTVYYRAHGMRVGYSIVDGKPLADSGGSALKRGGVTYWRHTIDGAHVLSWRQSGHTCVIAGRGVTGSTLVSLAAEEETEAAGHA